MLWSRGNEPIRRVDFLAADPLLIQFNGCVPLMNEMVLGSRNAIDPQARMTPNGFEIDFDILENDDSIHVSLLFDSSTAPAADDVRITGSISGLLGGCQKRNVHHTDKIISLDSVLATETSLIVVFVSSRIIYSNVDSYYFGQLPGIPRENLDYIRYFSSILFGILFLILGLFMMYSAFSAIWRSRNAISGSGRRFLKDRGIL